MIVSWTLRCDKDREIHRDVYQQNEYGIPDRMDGWSVLDVGGNFGAFAVLCAERGARVLSVEPERRNFDLLRQHAAGLTIDCRHWAAACKSGTVTLHTCDNPTAHTLYRTGWHNGRTEVHARTMNQLAELLPRPIDLCKIDAEGAEYELVPSWDFAPVQRLTIEFHGAFVRNWEHEAELCRGRLRELGFRELAWEPHHPECGWLRLYRGARGEW